jgi:NMD protein affecting ribosome stability and mRNA decay
MGADPLRDVVRGSKEESSLDGGVCPYCHVEVSLTLMFGKDHMIVSVCQGCRSVFVLR